MAFKKTHPMPYFQMISSNQINFQKELSTKDNRMSTISISPVCLALPIKTFFHPNNFHLVSTENMDF